MENRRVERWKKEDRGSSIIFWRREEITRKESLLYRRIIVREESETRKITKRNWIGNDSCTKRTSSKNHRRLLFLKLYLRPTCAPFVSFLSRCCVHNSFFYTRFGHIYVRSTPRIPSRSNEERRKGRRRGGNEGEEGSLSKKLTVYKKSRKREFFARRNEQREPLLLGARRKRGRFPFRQRITQFRGATGSCASLRYLCFRHCAPYT